MLIDIKKKIHSKLNLDIKQNIKNHVRSFTLLQDFTVKCIELTPSSYFRYNAVLAGLVLRRFVSFFFYIRTTHECGINTSLSFIKKAQYSDFLISYFNELQLAIMDSKAFSFVGV
jgi:hypothetical protein